MKNLATRKKLLPLFLFAIFIAILIVSAFSLNAYAKTVKPIAQNGKLKIAQISDIHYFPKDLCPTTTKDCDYKMDKYSDMKLISESGAVLNATIEKLLSNAKKDGLDYLIVSGDLTKNAEERAHIDLGNKLRKLQNDIRIQTDNPNFQILVINGNHDMYNQNAFIYDKNGSRIATKTINALEFRKIYSGLGFPDFPEEEIQAYTAEKDGTRINKTWNTPFTKFYDSTNATNIDLIYFSETIEKSDSTHKNYSNLMNSTMGSNSYIVKIKNVGYNFAMIDSALRTPDENGYCGYNHATGGKINNKVFTWLEKNLKTETKRQDTIIGVIHHNTIPHHKLQETYMQDFVLYNWEDACIKLTNMGIKYTLSGHVHANAVDSKKLINNKKITDIMTGSLISLGSPVRYLNFERHYDSDKNIISENLDSCSISIDSCEGIPDLQNYILENIYDNLIENLVDGFVNNRIQKLANDIVTNNEPENKWTPLTYLLYGLTNDLFNLKPTLNNEAQVNIVSYLKAVILQTINNVSIDNGKEKITLQDVIAESYFKFLTGDEVKKVEDNEKLNIVINELQSGNFARNLIYNTDNNKGILYPLLFNKDALLTQILDYQFDLEKYNLDEDYLSCLKTSLKMINLNPENINLRDIITTILPTINEFKDTGIYLNNLTIEEFAKGFVSQNFDNNFYTNIGNTLANILTSFAVDTTEDDPLVTTMDFTNIIKYNEINKDIEPTLENGLLPNLLTVSMQGDTTTTKNIKWHTNKYTNSVFEYRKTGEKKWNKSNIYTEKSYFGFPKLDIGYIALFSNTNQKDIEKEFNKKGWNTSIKYDLSNSVSLNKLLPNTKYEYRISTKCFGKIYGIDNIFTFKTAPKNGEFNVLGIENSQGIFDKDFKNINTNIKNTISNNNFNFILNTGNFVCNSNNRNQWHNALDNLQEVFANNSILAVNPKFKNHILNNYFNINLNKDKSKDSISYYSFTYSNAKFIVLDTFDCNKNGISEKQYKWLLNELDCKTDWKIVVLNNSFYGANSNLDNKTIALKNQLTSVFYDNDVDIVLQGNDNSLTTSKFLDRNGKPLVTPSNLNRPNGVLYMTIGNISNSSTNYRNNNKSVLNKDYSIQESVKNPTSVKLNFNGKILTINWNVSENDATLLHSKTMVIAKTRKIEKENNADITKLTIGNNKPIEIDLNNNNKINYVPFGTSIRDFNITKPKNSYWKYWETNIPNENDNFRAGLHKIVLKVTSENGKTTKNYNFNFYVTSKLEETIGYLKVNGKKIVPGKVYELPKKSKKIAISHDLYNMKNVIVKENIVNDDKSIITFSFDKENSDIYTMIITKNNLSDGMNNIHVELFDNKGNIVNYDIAANVEKDNTIKIIAIVVLALIIVFVLFKRLYYDKKILPKKLKKKKKKEYKYIVD